MFISVAGLVLCQLVVFKGLGAENADNSSALLIKRGNDRAI
jgi:hypothetical protein